MNSKYDAAMGKQIKKLRQKKGLNQKELEALLQLNGCDISRSSVSKIECGRRHIYSDEIKAVQEVLDVPFEELFVEKPEEPEESEKLE